MKTLLKIITLIVHFLLTIYTQVFKDNGTDGLLSIFYYDDKAQLIQSASRNHLGGTDYVTIQDKPNFEQINLINQLDEEDRTVVFKIIDTMLTKKKFKDFFQQNAAAL